MPEDMRVAGFLKAHAELILSESIIQAIWSQALVLMAQVYEEWAVRIIPVRMTVQQGYQVGETCDEWKRHPPEPCLAINADDFRVVIVEFNVLYLDVHKLALA